MTPTPANPSAIDLEPFRRRARHMWPPEGPEPLDDICDLIAAVEALRERVVDLEKLAEFLASNQCEAPHIDENGHMQCEYVEAAEARVVELAGALEPFANEDAWAGWDDRKGAYLTADFKGLGKPWVWAQDALAATPEDALERARAVEEVITAVDATIDSGRRFRSDPGAHSLALANLCNVMGKLAQLDALGKEEG